MLKWERKKKGNKDKKEKNGDAKDAPENNELSDIGLSPSKASSNISIHNENGTYISHANVTEIKKSYGTIHEYLKQRFGPGRYTITVKGKGSDETQHISIAGEESSSPWETPSGSMDSNQLMGVYVAMQAENARLKAELDANRNNAQQSMLGQIVPLAMDFIKTMMQSRPETDLASVMTAATQSLKTLSEIKTPGQERNDDVGGLMGGIAQLIQGFQQRQPQPMSSVPIPMTPTYATPAPPYIPMPYPAPSTRMQPTTIPPTTGPSPGGAGVTQNDETNSNNTNVFFENLIGMTEQKQSPKVVADYIIHSIRKIPPQEIAKLDPQMQVLVGQLQANPVAAFEAICQFEPSLDDEKYAAEISSELQKIAQG